MLLKVDKAQPQMQLFIEMTGGATASKVLPMVENARYADFALRLKEAMANKGLTVTDVKNALNVTYEMARRYTLGTAMPRDERMRRLGDFVGIPAAYLQFGDVSQLKLESKITFAEESADGKTTLELRATLPPKEDKNFSPETCTSPLGTLAAPTFKESSKRVDSAQGGAEPEGKLPDQRIDDLTMAYARMIERSSPGVQQAIGALLIRYNDNNDEGERIAKAIKALLGIEG